MNVQVFWLAFLAWAATMLSPSEAPVSMPSCPSRGAEGIRKANQSEGRSSAQHSICSTAAIRADPELLNTPCLAAPSRPLLQSRHPDPLFCSPLNYPPPSPAPTLHQHGTDFLVDSRRKYKKTNGKAKKATDLLPALRYWLKGPKIWSTDI